MPKIHKQSATYDEHIDLIKTVLGELKRDVFTGDLCYYEKDAKRWIPVLDDTALGHVKSTAIKLSEGEITYKPSCFEPHIHGLTREAKKELLVKIPAYDGQDRIGAIASRLKCKNLSAEAVESLLKQWCGKMITRIYDPLIQNTILVLQGDQGLGKDHLVKTLCGALGQFLIPFLIQQQERDTFQQLISGLVMHIQEYDRTNKTEVASLKNMITADRAFFRSAYGRKPNYYTIRASFIATCNVDGILRDWTGNRRYTIFELTDIDWSYPQGKEHEVQILAQCKELAKDGYVATDGARAEMERYLGQQTPENPENVLVEDYISIFEERYPVSTSGYAKDIENVWIQLNKVHGLNINYMKGIIKRKGYAKRKEKGIIYYKVKVTNEEESSDENTPF